MVLPLEYDFVSYYALSLGGGIKQWCCLTSDVCRVHREYLWRQQLLEARRAGRRSLRRKACMDWSWAAASGVQRRGHIVAASRLHLVNNLALDISEASEEHNACLYIHFSTQATLTSDLLDSKSYPHQRASGSTCVRKLLTLGSVRFH